MSGTDLREIGIDLAGAIGGNTGDGEVDRVTINGTVGDDTIHVQSLQETVAIDGLPVDVSIDSSKPARRRMLDRREAPAAKNE